MCARSIYTRIFFKAYLKYMRKILIQIIYKKVGK